MKVTAILLFRVKNAIAQPVLLASAMDLSSFSFFEKKPAREFLLFSCRTISMRTENGVRHCVKEGGTAFQPEGDSSSPFLACPSTILPTSSFSMDRTASHSCARASFQMQPLNLLPALVKETHNPMLRSGGRNDTNH